ncbi:hypothetical protein [Streptomyces alkaliphilus]|uniref:hypothetical protein n=1 Tax=Streptomyces alkaliphilus TaxID=1472722 RepID=UPI001E36807A|nr:hypothetical protein [Streptomyces alkaliphilus]
MGRPARTARPDHPHLDADKAGTDLHAISSPAHGLPGFVHVLEGADGRLLCEAVRACTKASSTPGKLLMEHADAQVVAELMNDVMWDQWVRAGGIAPDGRPGARGLWSRLPCAGKRSGVRGMAVLVDERVLTAWVEFYGMCLQDEDDTRVPVPFPEGFEDNTGFLTARPGRIDLRSAGHTHNPSMTVQVWDGPPPAPPGQWDETGQAELETSAGSVTICSLGSGPMPERIVLPHPGSWSVRVCCTGRDEVARRAALEGAVNDVERYVVQFWPATPYRRTAIDAPGLGE